VRNEEFGTLAKPIEDVGPEDDELGADGELLGVEANPNGGRRVVADGDKDLGGGLNDGTPGGVIGESGQVSSVDEFGPIAYGFGDGMIGYLDGSRGGKGSGARGEHGTRLIRRKLGNRGHDGDASGGFAGGTELGVEIDHALEFGWEERLGFDTGPGLLLDEVAGVVGGEIVLDVEMELDDAGESGEIDEIVAVAIGGKIDGQLGLWLMVGEDAEEGLGLGGLVAEADHELGGGGLANGKMDDADVVKGCGRRDLDEAGIIDGEILIGEDEDGVVGVGETAEDGLAEKLAGVEGGGRLGLGEGRPVGEIGVEGIGAGEDEEIDGGGKGRRRRGGAALCPGVKLAERLLGEIDGFAVAGVGFAASGHGDATVEDDGEG
jgi:hypothetical protein